MSAAATMTKAKPTASPTAVVMSLLLLVSLSVFNNLVYKFTQDLDGTYTYNTASSQLSVEVIKLTISAFTHAQTGEDTRSALHSGLNTKVCGFIAFLSVSYAFTNQLLFSIMLVADPGILSLFKVRVAKQRALDSICLTNSLHSSQSFTPVIVALLNRLVYSQHLTLDSYVIILIMCLGVSTVTSSADRYDTSAITLMMLSTLISSLNMVVNARIFSVTDLSMPLINCLMYASGAFVNLFIFLLDSRSGGRPFFEGYRR